MLRQHLKEISQHRITVKVRKVPSVNKSITKSSELTRVPA
ncbi:Uncharacterised protein [Mycobacterium tuberculosis]|nr:Uncharacterised protein [Mycobacterium tuberculosis]